MAFYLRKSINLGPIRLNLSKSGIGASGGVTGFRIGVNSKGKKYVHAGKGGLYYRTSLPPNTANKTPNAQPRDATRNVSHGPMMRHGSPHKSGVNDELISKMARAMNHRSILLHVSILLLAAIAMLAIIVSNRHDSYLALTAAVICIITILCAPFLFWVSAQRTADTHISLAYALDKQAASQWHDFCQVLIGIQASGIKALRGAAHVDNPKYHGGETRILDTAPLRINVDHRIRYVSCDTTTPAIESIFGTTYIFFPNFMLGNFGTNLTRINYDDLVIDTGTTRIPQHNAPREADVVGQTWQFVNKDGSIDKRFKDNPQLLIVEYATIRITTAAGMDHVLFILSKSLAGRFVTHLKHLAMLRAHCSPQYQNPANDQSSKTLEPSQSSALMNPTRNAELRTIRSTEIQNIYTIALRAYCCIAFSDGSCSRPERVAITTILRKMKSPWTEAEIQAKIRSHWENMLLEGFGTFLFATCVDLKKVTRETHKQFILKQLSALAKINSRPDSKRISAYKKLKAALSSTNN